MQREHYCIRTSIYRVVFISGMQQQNKELIANTLWIVAFHSPFSLSLFLSIRFFIFIYLFIYFLPIYFY